MISRRQMLGGAVAGVAATAVSGVNNFAHAWHPMDVNPSRVRQEMRTDVVVVGSGMGGLSTAVRALHSGARVIVLEKAEQPGGTCAHSEGGVANSDYDDMRAESPEGDPVVQRAVYDNVEQWYSFMEEIGAPMSRPAQGMVLGGQQQGRRVGRTIAPVIWVRFMVGVFVDRGGILMTETPMIQLLTNGSNEVIGVLAEGPNGPIRILSKAVVLASGGWMHNDAMVKAHISREPIAMRNVSYGRSTPLFTGDGYWAASQLGAAPSVGGWDGFYGHLLPAPPGRITEPMANVSMYHGHLGVAVNMYGRRFTDESAGKWAGRQYRRRNEQILNQEVGRQPEANSIYLWDGPIDRDNACAECALGGVDKFDAYRGNGALVATGNTWAEVTRQIEGWGRDIPGDVVLQEINEYNAAAAAGKTHHLRIPKTGADLGHTRPLTEGPFFATLGRSGMTATYGGLRIDNQGRVLNRYDRAIRGLFAAGIDIGGFSTYAYLGNLTLGAATGFLSGTNAARQPEPSGGWQVAPTGSTLG